MEEIESSVRDTELGGGGQSARLGRRQPSVVAQTLLIADHTPRHIRPCNPKQR